MATPEKDRQSIQQNSVKYVFNFFNIPHPNSSGNNNNTIDLRSPTPSNISDNSIECSLSGHNMVSDAASSYSEESEQELTSLTWLTELRNQSLTWPDSVQPIIDDDDSCDRDRKTNAKGPSRLSSKSNEEIVSIQPKKPSPSERYETFLDKVKKDMAQYDLTAEIYQTDPGEKPPFNYSHIIGMAMVENGRMTLQQICSYIETKFAFFRVRKKWNNSIRHNLSLHHCFRKIDRSKYEKGKGGYWELGIDPKKCDRKRIRNRKTSKNRITGHTNNKGKQSNNAHVDNHRTKSVEMFVLDELDVQQNIVISKGSSDNALTSEFVTSNHTPNDSRLHHYEINNPIKLQDVFIADVNNSGNVLASTSLPELEAIIVNPAAANISVPNVNMSEIQQQMNIFLEDEIPQPCENVVVSSYISNENQGQPNVIVEQMEPYYTISTAESNFRPYIDGIDEGFQYLRNMDSRCDDLFDNLLDISVSDY